MTDRSTRKKMIMLGLVSVLIIASVMGVCIPVLFKRTNFKLNARIKRIELYRPRFCESRQITMKHILDYLDHRTMRLHTNILWVRYGSTLLKINSLMYPFDRPPVRKWRREWRLEAIIQFIYGIVYMVPMPRQWKVGPRWGIKVLFKTRRILKDVKIEVDWRFGTTYKAGNYFAVRIDHLLCRIEDVTNLWSEWYGSIVTGIRRIHRDNPTAFYKTCTLMLIVPILLSFGLIMKFDNETFYAAGNGDDSWSGKLAEPNGGLTDGPFEHITKFEDRFNAGNANPDDKFYCKRDETFTLTEHMYWRISSASLGHPFVFGAYGSGAKPIWDGVSSTYYNIFIVDYVTFENIDCLNIQGGGVQFTAGNADILADSCMFRGGNATGISFSGTGGDGAEIRSCEIKDTVSYGIRIVGAITQGYSNTVTVGCTVHDVGHDAIHLHQFESTPFYDLGDHHDVYQNTTYNNATENSLDVTAGDDHQDYSNNFYNCPGTVVAIGHMATNVHYKWNYIHDQNGPNHQITFSTPSVEIWGNLFRGDPVSTEIVGINNDGASDPTGPPHPVTDIHIVKNTFIWGGGNQRELININDVDGDMGTIELASNGFDTSSGYQPYYGIVRFRNANYNWNDPDFTANKNVYKEFSCHDVSSGYISWSTWQGAGRDLNGLDTDPLLNDVAGGDFRPTDLSPTIGLGPSTGSYSPDIRSNAMAPNGTGSGIDTQYVAGPYEQDLTVDAPTLTTNSASSVAILSATLNGNITDTGAQNCTIRGFYLNTSQTKDGSTIVNESGSFGTGVYSLPATGLDDNTTYHYLAYATNSEGDGEGSWKTFTTIDAPEITLGSGELLKISDGENIEDIDFEIDAGGTLKGMTDDADYSLGHVDNEGTMGDASRTGTTTVKSTVNCGDYLGSDSSLEPPVCSQDVGTRLKRRQSKIGKQKKKIESK